MPRFISRMPRFLCIQHWKWFHWAFWEMLGKQFKSFHCCRGVFQFYSIPTYTTASRKLKFEERLLYLWIGSNFFNSNRFGKAHIFNMRDSAKSLYNYFFRAIPQLFIINYNIFIFKSITSILRNWQQIIRITYKSNMFRAFKTGFSVWVEQVVRTTRQHSIRHFSIPFHTICRPTPAHLRIYKKFYWWIRCSGIFFYDIVNIIRAVNIIRCLNEINLIAALFMITRDFLCIWINQISFIFCKVII